MNFFFLLNTKEDILKNVGNSQWALVTDILQNILFCVQQKKEMYTCLKQLEGK